MAYQYNSAYTGPEIDAAIAKAQKAIITDTQTLDDAQKQQVKTNLGITDVKTDTTLTVSGAAADAKITGDKITEAKTAADNAMLSAFLAKPGALKWDGAIRGRVHIDFEASSEMMMTYVHISDEVPPVEVLSSGRAFGEIGTMEGAPQYAGVIEIMPYVEGEVYMTDAFTIVMLDNYTLEGITFPKKGVYAIAQSFLPSGIDVSMLWGSAIYIPGFAFKDSGAGEYFEEKTAEMSLGDTATWSETGVVTNTITEMGLTVFYRKVSDSTPTVDEINAQANSVYTANVNGATSQPEAATASLDSDGTIATIADSGICIVYKKEATTSSGIVFPETGLYFAHVTAPTQDNTNDIYYYESFTLPGYNFVTAGTETIIKTEHLPEALRFGEETVGGDTITWDGDTTGLEAFEGFAYKVSDVVPTADDLKMGFAIIYDSNGTQGTLSKTAEEIEAAGGISAQEDGLITFEVVTVIPEGNTRGVTPGTYFMNYNGIVAKSFTVTGYTGFETTTITKIDPKYLPDNVGRDYTWDDIGSKNTVLCKGEYSEVSSDYAELEYIASPAIGDTGSVVFDGVNYDCVVAEIAGFDATAIGNLALMGFTSDTDEPFLVVLRESTQQAVLYVQDKTQTHTAQVTGVSVIKIPEKYISDQIVKLYTPSGSEDPYLYHELDHKTKVTVRELESIYLRKGTMIIQGFYYGIYTPFVYRSVSADTGSYSVLSVMDYDGTIKSFYTAEYTAE